MCSVCSCQPLQPSARQALFRSPVVSWLAPQHSAISFFVAPLFCNVRQNASHSELVLLAVSKHSSQMDFEKEKGSRAPAPLSALANSPMPQTLSLLALLGGSTRVQVSATSQRPDSSQTSKPVSYTHLTLPTSDLV